jgi:hypothetical protein
MGSFLQIVSLLLVVAVCGVEPPTREAAKANGLRALQSGSACPSNTIQVTDFGASVCATLEANGDVQLLCLKAKGRLSRLMHIYSWMARMTIAHSDMRERKLLSG